MKKLLATLMLVAGLAGTSHAMPPCACGGIAPAVPVVSYYGAPAVDYEPGHWSSAGPCCGFDGIPYGPGGSYSNYSGWGHGYYGRPPLVTTHVYYPGQPLRNVFRALAP